MHSRIREQSPIQPRHPGDTETTNLIRYQHAYNAAARVVTAFDEMLDRIINNMGIVGR